MTETLITPDLLEADATVPQCLDNQFVSDATLDFMLSSGLDYRAEEVIERRRTETRTEFVRSLIYSSQVLVNRAYLVNNPFLYERFDTDSMTERAAFARLLGMEDRSQAVVPFLFDESDLGPLIDPRRADEVRFEINPAGRDALRALVDTVDDSIRCVRLDRDAARNADQIGKLAKYFKQYFIGTLPLVLDEPSMVNIMASELVGPELSRDPDGWSTFNAQLEELYRYASDNRPELSRQLIYRDFLAAGDDVDARGRNVARGRFAPASAQRPLQRIVKKLADLRYNTALPDFVDRYAFTPAALPSRIALQEFEPTAHGRVAGDDAHETLVDSFTAAKRLWHAEASRAMDLPLLSDLSMQDVSEIRSLPTWRPFADAQNDVLRSASPRALLDTIAPFEARFEAFQTALAEWYRRKHASGVRSIRADRVASYVTFGIQIAGQAVLLGLQPPQGLVETVGRAALVASLTRLPERIRGYTVSLYVTMFKGDEIDRQRSYSVDLLHSAMELTREDVVAFLRRVDDLGGDPADLSGVTEIADQGTDAAVQ